MLAGAGLAVVAIGLGFGGRARMPLAAVAALAVVVVSVDLFRANMGFNPAIRTTRAEQPATGAIRYLQSRVPLRFAGVGDAGALQPLGVNLAMRYGLYDARGYDFPVEKRYDTLWRAEVGPPGEVVPSTAFALPTARALRALSLLSVADVMQDPAGPPLRLPGLRLAYEGEDARVYSNPAALPRAFLVDRQRTVTNADAALAAVTRSEVDTRRVAVTERPVPGLPQDREQTPEESPGSARLVDHGREKLVVQTDARLRALLVVTDVYYPGWKAWVDDRSVPIERVDYLLRGVSLPPGRHRIELRYEPASWQVGWIVSAVAVIAVVVVALSGLRRRRILGTAA